MTSTEIRDSFLAFFRERGHEIVPSSPVVLPSDPTLLFANAGMNQFKDIFLGARAPAARRVADSQKCIRVSGKHNDLEEVGLDTYHHTFFEMLGNWSFGDYYKREAIGWAWELLTGVWKLPKPKLWVTVFRDDEEAARIWRETTDIDPTHILRFGEKDNFWEMGETGPCGPCSEIHFDGTESGATPDMVNAGRPDVIEIWNLVFIQYNRRSDGSLEELPAKHVDTGMGFERIVRVLQGKASNYDTDVFAPLIHRLCQRSNRAYEGDDAVAMRVIADHVRTLSFAIADGVLPSNEGRGYVLRRLLRRAVRFGRRLGFTQPFLGELFAVLEHTMGGAYPELARGRERILRAVRAEEAGFAETLDRGLALFDAVVARVQGAGRDVFPGDDAFRLYDTYGFPIDLTRLMAREAGLSVDEHGFERLMQEQRERARQARRGAGPQREADVVADLVARGIKSRFVGYATPETETRLLAIFADDATAAELTDGQAGAIVLAESPFYAESGGQIADKGVLTGPDGQFEVTDVQRPAEGLILHTGRVTKGRIRDGDTVHAMIDRARRARVAAHHTATHLLNAALREFVHAGIKQAGSLVTPDRLRFDFTWFEAVPRDVLARIEERVNEWIAQNAPVRTYDMAFREVADTDIVALFDETYGDVVRVVEVPGVSRELCGGTHAATTGQIALFRIASESSVAAGVRRIEAVCGLPAYLWTRREHELVRSLCETFSSTPEELPARIAALTEQNRAMEKDRRQQAAKAAVGRVDEIAARGADVRGVPVVAECVGEMEMDPLRQLLDALRQKRPSAVLLLGSTSGGKACFVAAVSDDLVRRGVHAGKLVGQIAKAAGGGGGGQPGRAQAGAKDGAKAAEAVAQTPRIVESMLGA